MKKIKLKEIKLNESHFKKDYRKILNIPENADEKMLVRMTADALQYMKDPQILEAAKILNDPFYRREYYNGRKKMFMRQEAEEKRKNKEADAEIKADKKKKKAERDAKRKEERDKQKAERKLERDKKRIAKNTENYIKKYEEKIDNNTNNREKVVYIYSDEITANKGKYIFKKFGTKAVICLILAGLFVGAWHQITIREKINTFFNKDNDKEISYDEVSTVVATALEEQEINIQANSKTRSVEPQELEEIQAVTFTDASDNNQVKTRATALSNHFKANNYYGVTEDELADQIRYINESYNADTDNEAYDINNSTLDTFKAYSNTIIQNDNYIRGVSENGITIGLGLDAFLIDNSLNKEIVVKVSKAFQNLLASKTSQEQVDSANELLSLEYELMKGLKQNSDGTNISYDSLSSSEGFIIGLMFQLSNSICPDILGENGKIPYIPYTNINGEEVLISFEELQAYYNPKRNNEFDYENAWAKYYLDLIKNAEAQKNTYN